MSMIQLILEQPGQQGRRNGISLRVRDDIPVDQFVANLIERLQIQGREPTLRYRLYIVGGARRALPGDQSFQELHIQSGTHLYLGADDVGTSTVPRVVQEPVTSFFRQRFDRRTLLLALVTAATAGLLSGASTVLAQREWSHIGPISTPHPVRKTLLTLLQFRFTAHDAPVRTVAWSPDGAFLASGADDATLLIWRPDGTVRQRVTLPNAVRSLAWSPGGKRLAAAVGTVVAFIDAQNGQVLSLPRAHQADVTSVVWSTHAGNPVVSGSLDRRAIVWQTQDYQPQGSFTRHTAPINALTAAPHGSTIIASSSEGGVIRLWNLNTLQEVHGFYQDVPIAMLSTSFASDGIRLAVGAQDGVIRIWGSSLTCQNSELAGGEQHCADAPQRLQGHTAPVRTVAWSPDGRYLATGGDDAQVRVWDSTTHFAMLAAIAHDAPVNAVSWAPGPGLPLLATASGNAVHLWRFQFVDSSGRT